jgi:hypothetical protein
MLTLAMISAASPSSFAVQPCADTPLIASTLTASSAPTTITEEMALVTLISGVCRAGVTAHTT